MNMEKEILEELKSISSKLDALIRSTRHASAATLDLGTSSADEIRRQVESKIAEVRQTALSKSVALPDMLSIGR